MPSAPPSVERPCQHNEWYDLRTRKNKFKIMRCTVCQKKWKLPVATMNMCPGYRDGRCGKGQECAALHIIKGEREKKLPKLLADDESDGDDSSSKPDAAPQQGQTAAQRKPAASAPGHSARLSLSSEHHNHSQPHSFGHTQHPHHKLQPARGFPLHAADTVFQFSTASAVGRRSWPNGFSLQQIAEHADFGVGVLSTRSEELIMLQGRLFAASFQTNQVRELPRNSSESAAFATATVSGPEGEALGMPQVATLEGVKRALTSCLDLRYFWTIRMSGTFTTVQLQRLPEAGRADSGQNVLRDVRGSLLGFFTPDAFSNTSLPGFSFSFIDSTRTVGGGVQDFTLTAPRVLVCKKTCFHCQLPVSQKTGRAC
ncbi:Alpha-acetolactate decarboxylase [Diplonema papillatum]|nr:Alpha-acetolactate decarboxylase [Diplonema papillatum]